MLNNFEFNLYLIRHGESEVNARPDEVGQTADVKLTANGMWQAKLLGERFVKQNLIFDKVFSSPYVRAYDTAKLSTSQLSGDSPLIFVADNLKEYYAGDWTGGSRKALMTPEVIHKMNVLNHAFMPPNGETLHQVQRRASQFLEESILYNKDLHKLANGKRINIACFSHGMTIKSLLQYVMGFDRDFTWKVKIDNASISQLNFGPKGWALSCINDTAHLY